jgi:hypothetical protein
VMRVQLEESVREALPEPEYTKEPLTGRATGRAS